ncbi:hypothetical protein ACFX12_044174 [Malus domestica]
MYDGRFSHEYSHCAEADDKTALKAFTAGIRDCFFKYMINANTWKTYSEVIAQAYNHVTAEARTYQEKPSTTIPYQQVRSGSQTHPNEKTSTFQTVAVSPPALLNTLPSQQTYQSQGKRKDFHPRPQAVNTVGQAHVKTGPTPRYKAYTSLNATCMAIYLSIAHLIPKPKPSHPDYEPTKNTGMFCCYHEHNSHEARSVSPFVIILKLWHVKEKLINSSFTLQRVTITNAW